MVHCIRFMLAVLILTCATDTTVSANEVTMRLRGGEQEFSGKLITFDGSVYVLETQLFGEMNFDVSRFECISGPCAPSEKGASVAPTSTDDAPPVGLTRDRQIELFEGFRDWNNFETFLEWRKNNPR